jgi:hypothetical protein
MVRKRHRKKNHIQRTWNARNTRRLQLDWSSFEGPGLVIIGAYAPHEGRPIEEKEEFYKQLDKRCWKITKKKELLCIGDFNVRWHARRDHEHDTLGPFTVGRGNDFMEKKESKLMQATNRELCMDWRHSNDMVHSRSWFEKDIERKITYRELGTPETQDDFNWIGLPSKAQA